MAKLTTAERNKLPDSAFAGPHRSYPVEDRAHAKAAKSRASQAFNAGAINKAEEEKINAKADKVLKAFQVDRTHGRKRGKGPGCARPSWRNPAGESPAQVRGSARLVASVARDSAGDGGREAYTAIAWGVY